MSWAAFRGAGPVARLIAAWDSHRAYPATERRPENDLDPPRDHRSPRPRNFEVSQVRYCNNDQVTYQERPGRERHIGFEWAHVSLTLIAVLVSGLALWWSYDTRNESDSFDSAPDPAYITVSKTDNYISVTNGSRHDLSEVYVFSGWEDVVINGDDGATTKLIRWYPRQIKACNTLYLYKDVPVLTGDVEGEGVGTNGSVYVFWTDIGGNDRARVDAGQPYLADGSFSVGEFSERRMHAEIDGPGTFNVFSYSGGLCSGV
jgi:hypothetical protein